MKVVMLCGAAALALTLAACDAGSPAAKAPPPAAPSAGSGPVAAPGAVGAAGAAQGAAESGVDPRDLPVPLAADGKPLWAANRRHTAEENAAYQFGKNGKDFGAASEADYVARAHAFADSPPVGIERLTRSNGDALLYDARSNTFAVVAKTGAPRTMFKPRGGEAYWKEQQDRESDRGSGDDNGQG